MGRPSAPRSRGKTSKAAWLDRVTVPWTSVFPPALSREGYGATVLDPAFGLKRSPADGGWTRETGTALLLVYDSGDADQVKAVQALEADGRFVAASHLFDCFRMDLRGNPQGCESARVTLYDAKAQVMGEGRGRRLRDILVAMNVAYKAAQGRELTKVLPSVEQNLGGIAWNQQSIEAYQGCLVCPHCGELRQEAVEKIAQAKAALAEFKKALLAFRI
jgi:hypothetical protein